MSHNPFLNSHTLRFSGSARGKESTWQCRRHKGNGFSPWLRKNSWRERLAPTPVFLPEESQGQRGLAGYMVHGVAKSLTRMKQFSMHSHILWLYRVNTSVIFNRYRWDLFPINLLLFCRFSVNFQLTEMWKLNIKLFFFNYPTHLMTLWCFPHLCAYYDRLFLFLNVKQM